MMGKRNRFNVQDKPVDFNVIGYIIFIDKVSDFSL